MKKQVSIFMAFFVITLCAYDYLPDDIPLNQVLLALSHNGAQSKARGWRYYQQLGDVKDQWKAGSRGDKINIHWRRDIGTDQQIAEEAAKKKGGKVVGKIRGFFKKSKEPQPYIGLCHEGDGTSNCLISIFQKKGTIDKAEDYFRWWAQMLKENPKDIIVLIIEDYTHQNSKENGTEKYTSEQIQKELDAVLEKSGLAAYAYKIKDGDAYPTIGQMRSTDKRALIFDDNSYNSFRSPYLTPEFFRTTDWRFDWEKDLKEDRCTMRPERGRGAHYFVIDVGPEQSIPDSSKKGKLLSIPEKITGKSITISRDNSQHMIAPTNYKKVNGRENIIKRVNQCQKQDSGQPVTAMKIDFIEIGDVYAATKEINNERISKWRQYPL